MHYWKGLMIALAVDIGWIMGGPVATGPEPLPPREFAVAWSDVPLSRPSMERDIDALNATSLLEDSLMARLQEHGEDVAAMERLAQLYLEMGGADDAINPLARALQIEPTRRSLWAALDKALAKAGIAKITDKELALRALEFVEAVDMWGHGC